MGSELEISRRAGELRRREMRTIRAKRIVRSPLQGLKALSRMRFTSWGYRSWAVFGSSRRYHREVGDGTGNSAVQATLAWIARTFPEAPFAIWERTAEGEEDLVPDHPLIDLLHQPNPFYSGETLWSALLWDYHTDGNAYALKIRDGLGGVQELWWVPHQLMQPKGSKDVFVTHYEYTPGGDAAPVQIAPEDVVHFRNGLDPDNPRKGRSPMRALLAEVFTDEEAATYTATILRNMGVPGVIVSPDTDAVVSDADVQAAKQRLREATTGDNRGEPLVFPSKTKIETFGFSPEQMDLRALRRVPEERITAVLGVPAIVVGLGAGLDRSTFANYAEAREAAYESRIIPDQRILAAVIRFQLLPDFEGDPQAFRPGFDLSEVRVLQPDEDKIHERAREDYRAGIITRAQAKRAIGVDAGDDDDVYAVPISIVLTPAKAAGAAALQDELDAEAAAPAPVPPALQAAADPAQNGHTPVPPELVGATP